MKTTLTTDMSWRGVLYETGDREIPDDLAIALGLMEPAAPVVTTPDPVADFNQIIEAVESLTKTPKPPRRKGA